MLGPVDLLLLLVLVISTPTSKALTSIIDCLQESVEATGLA